MLPLIVRLFLLFVSVFSSTADPGLPPRGHHKPFGHHARRWKRLPTVYAHPHPEIFYRDFVRPSRPLVIKGGAADWPAIVKWRNISYLRSATGDELLTVNWKKIYSYDRHHAIRVDMTMSEFLDKFDKHDLYMDSTIPRSFHQDVLWPRSLACKFFVKRLKQLAIMMNNGRSRSDVHIDATDTYFVQTTGRRLWLLMPPDSVRDVYSGHPHLVDHCGVSALNQTFMDFEKHPRAAKLDVHAALLNPGDIIYVPEGWYHQVVTNGRPNIAIVAFLNVLFCEYHSKRAGDVNHVRTCVQDVRRRKPRTLQCREFPSSNIIDLLRQQRPRNRGAFNESPLSAPNNTERNLRYAKPLSDGSSLPALGLSLHGMTAEALRDGRVLRQALHEGITLFATSPDDGSEPALGSLLSRRPKIRKQLSILSLLPLSFLSSASSIPSAIDDSLRALKTSKIDFLLLQGPDCRPNFTANACTRDQFNDVWAQAWAALESVQRQGKIRFLGLSDFSLSEVKQFKAKAKLPITIVRARFDLYFRNALLRNFCKQHRIHFMGRSVLGRRWKEEAPDFPLNRDVFKEYAVHRAAYQYKVSIHAVVYDWAIKKEVVVMPRINDPLHVRVNVKAIDSESLHLPDHLHILDMLDPHDAEGLSTPYARPDFHNDTGTVGSQKIVMREIREFHQANFSEQIYTDERDFEIFPSYMTEG